MIFSFYQLFQAMNSLFNGITSNNYKIYKKYIYAKICYLIITFIFSIILGVYYRELFKIFWIAEIFSSFSDIYFSFIILCFLYKTKNGDFGPIGSSANFFYSIENSDNNNIHTINKFAIEYIVKGKKLSDQNLRTTKIIDGSFESFDNFVIF